VLDQVAATGGKHRFSKAEATPAGSGAEPAHAPLPGAAWRTATPGHGDAPHFLADLWGAAATALRVSGPEGADLQERIEAADCTVGVLAAVQSAAVARAAACPGAPYSVSAVRLEVFSSGRPPDSRSPFGGRTLLAGSIAGEP